MKATGIVRRIDDLGRVVIPKEIRRQMKIREGDPLEIYTTSEGGVVFKRYQPIDQNSFATAGKVVDRLLGHRFWVLCDRYGETQARGCAVAEEELLDHKAVYTKKEIRVCGEVIAELYAKAELTSEEIGIACTAISPLLEEDN